MSLQSEVDAYYAEQERIGGLATEAYERGDDEAAVKLFCDMFFMPHPAMNFLRDNKESIIQTRDFRVPLQKKVG